MGFGGPGWVGHRDWRGQRVSSTLTGLVGAPITTQGNPAIQIIARDITERKKAAQALQKLNVEPEAGVRGRTAELEESRAQLNTVLSSSLRGQRYMPPAMEVSGCIFKEHVPELVMSGINMPVMDGMLMATRIKALKADARIVALEFPG